MSFEQVCREYCETHKLRATGFASMLEYEQCVFDCGEFYRLLRRLADMVREECRMEALDKPLEVRDRFLEGCVKHGLRLVAHYPELVEKLLELAMSDYEPSSFGTTD